MFKKRSLLFSNSTPETINPKIFCSKEKCEVNENINIETRLQVLENNESEIVYFNQVFSPTGSIAIPTGASIQLDQFPGGVDAFVNTIAGGQPTGEFPTSSTGEIIDVLSFDALGNYTLSGVPSSYPVGIIYVIKINDINKNNLNLVQVVEYWEPKLDAYVYDVPIASTTWVVLHNLGYEPEVQALLTTGEEIEGN